MPYYDEPDDDYYDPEPVELVTAACPICGKKVTFPEHPRVEEDEFCSATCYNRYAAARAADYDQAMQEQYEADAATMRDASCVRCHKTFTDYPECLGWCHDHACEMEYADRLYAEQHPDNEIPF